MGDNGDIAQILNHNSLTLTGRTKKKAHYTRPGAATTWCCKKISIAYAYTLISIFHARFAGNAFMLYGMD